MNETCKTSPHAAGLLARHLFQCEENYRLWINRIPAGQWTQWHYQSPELGSLKVRKVEGSRYTETFEVDMQPAGADERFHLCLPVRLYHDARVCEVLADRRGRQLPARPEYPNEKMWYRDEKFRLNAHLRLWLESCETVLRARRTV
jgi:hypothetical protein